MSKMKFLLAAIVLSSLVIVNHAQDQDNRYDNMKVDEVLANKRLLTAYIKCVLEQGKCTPEGRELKSRITEALQNGCDQCTDKQKQAIRKVIGHLMNKEPKRWHELVEKYDPKGIYAHKYEKELKAV